MNHPSTLRHSKSHRAKVRDKWENKSAGDLLREFGIWPRGGGRLLPDQLTAEAAGEGERCETSKTLKR